MAQITWDQATAAQLDAVLKAASTATDKYNGYSSTILGSIPSPVLYAVKPDTTQVAIGSLTQWERVGTALQIVAQTTSGTAAAALAEAGIDHYLLVSGSRSARIEKAQLTMTGSIPSGAFTAAIGPITVTMPNFGTDGGGGGGGGAVFTAGSPPGSGWTTVLASTDSPIVIPDYFVGSHRWLSLPASGYGFALHRSHDARGSSALPSGAEDVSMLWARMHPARYSYNRAALDDWIQKTPGKSRCLTIFGTPTWARKYTDTASGRAPFYPSFPDAASAPADNAYLSEFVSWVYAPTASGGAGFTPAQIPFVESWNEPSFGSFGASYSAPTIYNRWTDAGNQFGGNPCFFNGSAVDLTGMTQAIKSAAPAGVTVIGCGFEIGVESDLGAFPQGVNTRNLNAFRQAGGFAHCDMASYHSYMYSNDPQVVTAVGGGVKAWMAANSIALPLANTETGHEAAGYASNYSNAQLAATVIRSFTRSAANGDKFYCVYQDRGAGDQKTMGDPATRPEVLAALNEVYNKLNGKTMRQFSTHSDGRVWARTSDNNEITG